MSLTTAILLISVVTTLILPVQSKAELFAMFQVGATVPQNLSDIETKIIPNATFGELQLDNSFLYGGKVGGFLAKDEFPWLGFEFDVHTTTPDIKAQSLSVTLGGTAENAVQATDFRVTTLALNILGRYPGTYHRFQPYGGVGVGLFFASLKRNGQSVSDTTPGLEVLAGTRYFLSDHVALMAEYKFNHTRFTFDSNTILGLGFPTEWEANYSAHLLTVGIGYHF